MNFLGLLTGLLGRPPKSLNLPSHVHTSARGDRTVVSIDHRIPRAAASSEGWRITTQNQFLPSAHFGRKAREVINGADAAKGRRLYCIDLARCEVVAAMSYHIDKRRRIPVMLTAIGLRQDADASPEFYDCSRGAAVLLKQYVHEIAVQVGRGGFVDIDAADVQAIRDLSALGFQRAPQVPGLRPSGTHLRQLPLA
jgi:hypothetical protein